MRIVITGSHGFIGSHLVKTLKGKGHEVVCIDIQTGYDVCDWNSVKDIEKFDIMIHLAALIYIPKSYEIPREMFNTNITGTLNMLELCWIHNAKMIFNSSYVYGNPKYLPIDEDHPITSFNPYNQSKIIGEKLCETYNRNFNVPVIIFRIFNVYGLGQSSNFLIPFIQKQIQEGKDVVLENPAPKRDYIHIKDVIRIYEKALQYKESKFEVFNVGSGTSHSAEEVAKIMIKESSKEIKLIFTGKERPNEVMNTLAKIDKIQKHLNWTPEISLKDGLKNLMKEPA
ncbi:MAG: GDP-mannose 4,6-dehydratase [Candidatus Marinimicrobia bacterium]|nr:GDP-mannose 4,6-dehydratase [Candidatus Neomarinimicrobiota bacterium]